MVIGKYEANHQKGIDTLELLRDGTYKYYYSFDGKEVTNSNSWEFKMFNGKPTITFRDFVFGLPGYSKYGAGFWVVEVEKSFFKGKLRLCIDPDLGYYYIKKDPTTQ